MKESEKKEYEETGGKKHESDESGSTGSFADDSDIGVISSKHKTKEKQKKRFFEKGKNFNSFWVITSNFCVFESKFDMIYTTHFRRYCGIKTDTSLNKREKSTSFI